MKEYKVGGACSTHESLNCIYNFIRKREGNKLFGRSKYGSIF